MKYKIDGLRFLSDCAIIIEKPPCLRTIKLEEHNYFLSFPYIIFVIEYTKLQRTYRMSNLYVFSKKEPLVTFQDQLYIPPLPNLNGSGALCYGNGRRYGSSIGGLANTVLSYFWTSSFDYSLETQWTVSLSEWKVRTKRNPYYWKRMIMNKTPRRWPQLWPQLCGMYLGNKLLFCDLEGWKGRAEMRKEWGLP